jgi:hypothetical protein
MKLNKTSKVVDIKEELLGRWKEREKECGELRDVNVIKVHYIHIWKCHNMSCIPKRPCGMRRAL